MAKWYDGTIINNALNLDNFPLGPEERRRGVYNLLLNVSTIKSPIPSQNSETPGEVK